MSVIAAMISRGVRLAVAAVLSLAVLMASSGVHPTSHCSDHEDCPASASMPDLAEPEPSADGEGLCLTCDCTCQSVAVGEEVILQVSAVQSCRLHPVDRQLTPESVVIEVDPPPVRAS
jgi:hypothetical protein